ncbi:MAG TPA: hypothetical protein VER14_00865, partial [Phototrophicaceae bacterium]|nr:hypothetical protein [Phototrophicaceae bacterium]
MQDYADDFYNSKLVKTTKIQLGMETNGFKFHKIPILIYRVNPYLVMSIKSDNSATTSKTNNSDNTTYTYDTNINTNSNQNNSNQNNSNQNSNDFTQSVNRSLD